MFNSDNTLESLRSERDRFVAFAFANADILVELDTEGNILFADGATTGLIGRKAEEMIGRNFNSLIYNEDLDLSKQLLNDIEIAGRLENVKIRLKGKYNDCLPFSMSGYRLTYLRNHFYLTLSLIKADISADELHKRDIYSGLLKVENFAKSANTKIREAQAAGKELKVTLLDFPELKAFLDSLPGNQAAALMGEISNYLRAKSVDGDTAGIINNNAYSFVHDANVDTDTVMRELVAITKKADPKGVGLEMHVQTLDTDVGKLTEQDSASALLYTINKFADQQGEKFDIHSLSEGYQSLLDETVNKIAEFKQTVASNNFQVAFQPIVDLKTGIIHHYETLVRFEHPNGFDNPFKFITFGEQAGIIGEFDLAMTQKTLDILEDAASKGNRPLVSVNLSGKSLGSSLFMDSLRGILDLNQHLRKQVIFEVTESSKIQDLKSANSFLQDMRNAGNLCCLDDFGAGESSFDYLRSLQVDFIKIDGSYIRESIASQRGRHMLKAMAGLCRDLDIVTIGEMVEDERAAHILWESGVRFGQGYLFGKPTIDATTLANCSKPTPFYNGIMRAKKINRSTNKSWWARKD